MITEREKGVPASDLTCLPQRQLTGGQGIGLDHPILPFSVFLCLQAVGNTYGVIIILVGSEMVNRWQRSWPAHVRYAHRLWHMGPDSAIMMASRR